MANQIHQIRQTGGGASFKLRTSYAAIVEKVGEPNVTDLEKDEYKVKASWGFEDNAGRQGFIWCFYAPDALTCREWSADGDEILLRELFGDAVIKRVYV